MPHKSALEVNFEGDLGLGERLREGDVAHRHRGGLSGKIHNAGAKSLCK